MADLDVKRGRELWEAWQQAGGEDCVPTDEYDDALDAWGEWVDENAPALLDAAENYESCEEANTALYELLDELRGHIGNAAVRDEFSRRIMASEPKRLAELRARIAELEAEREWQPIDTAPKDGTEVLLLVYGMDTYRSWATDSRWFTELPSGHLFWFDDEDVTHWAPLPKIPEDT